MQPSETVKSKPASLELDPGSLPATLSNVEKGEIAESVLGRFATAIIHNFDGNELQRWRLTAIASSSEPKKFTDLGGGVLAIKYFYAHPVQVIRLDGEVIDATRVVLFQPDESAFAFVSQGIAKGLGQIISIFGWGPYNPPIECRVSQTATKSGHIYNLVPAGR
jgi:Phage Single-stranded DNA-binding protein